MITFALRPIRFLIGAIWRLCRSEHMLYAGVLWSQLPAAISLRLYPSLDSFDSLNSVKAGTLGEAAGLLLLVPYAIALVFAPIRGRWLLWLVGLAGGHVFAFGFIVYTAGYSDQMNLELAETIAVWAARVSLAYFILCGRVRSPEYLAAVVALFFVAPYSAALMFAGVTLGLRFVYLVVWQNFTILLDIGLRRTAFLSVKSLLYWSPILLFMIPSLMLTNYIHEATLTSIYENGILTSTSTVVDATDADPHVEGDLIKRIGSEFETARTAVDNKLDAIQDAVDDNVQGIPNEVLSMYREIVPSASQIPGLAPSDADCDFPWIPCLILHEIIESIKSGIRSSYDRMRDKQGLKIYYETKAAADDVNAESHAVIADAKANMEQRLIETEEATKASVRSVFRALDIAMVVSNIALAMVMIRSYLYVFARVTFTRRSKASVSLRPKGKTPQHGSVKKWGREFGIDASCPEDFYVSRRFEPNGRAPNFAVPRPFAGILRRIRAGSYTMNRIRFGKGRSSVYFTAVQGAEFVSWNLKAGETVVFDYKNFVAMSERISLSSEVSFRISSLIFGRIVFPTATGPGTLVLQSKGNPTIGTEQRSSASVPPSRILAWHDHTRFTVESELNFVDMYMSAVYLERVGNAPVIIDADTMSSPASGMVRFIRYFILPM